MLTVPYLICIAGDLENYIKIYLSEAMISLIEAENHNTSTTAAIARLAKAINLSKNQFSLLLACCNSDKKQHLLSLLHEFSPIAIAELSLSASAQTLYTTITNALGSKEPEALMVHGLESVVAINQLIISTNLMRDEFAKQFQFPLVLWVNDEILRKLILLAPDLKDWAATTIRFDLPDHVLVE
ncbi:WD repeat-containing protein [Fischerella sp. NIES-4106]|nr:WD repeat-containing protein [Fischerella sp. NIES-4106]